MEFPSVIKIAMLRCKDCRIVLEDDVRFCPKCGKDLAPNASVSRPSESNVESLLASANLHKIRAEWEAAIADATDALRLDPHNPDIASLLGDIYAERGMLDEAQVWYQMALELNPRSETDRLRLEKLSEEIAAKRREERTSSFAAFQKHTRIWTISLAAVFVLLVVTALAVTLFRTKSHDTATPKPKPTATAQPQVSLPTAEPTPPGPAIGPESSAKTPAASGGSSLRTPAEAGLRTALSSAQVVSDAQTTIDDVIADPRTGVVTVTFSVPYRGVVSREQIIRAAAAVARTVFALRQDANFVTARCVVQGSGLGPMIAFVGDAARQSVEALGENPTDQQLAAIFTRPWWHPEIRE